MVVYDIKYERAKALAAIAERHQAKLRRRKLRVWLLAICLVLLLAVLFSYAFVGVGGK